MDYPKQFDVIVAGWTLCHIIDDFPKQWRQKMDALFIKLAKSQSSNSKIIVIETLGTRCSSESAPPHLSEYYSYLLEQGFTKQVIRTDYKFETLEQAKRLVPFFFGEEMLSKLEGDSTYILPECTGIWSKKLSNN